MSNYLPNGRNKHPKGGTYLPRAIVETKAFRALKPKAQMLYVFLRMEWKGEKEEYNNNGQIRFSVRQAAKALNIGKDTAGKAFHMLQHKGFIVVITGAILASETSGKCAEFELTELPLPGQKVGRALFLQWREGKDFSKHNHPTNNREGRNGRNKTLSRKSRRPCLENLDGLAASPTVRLPDRPENQDEKVSSNSPTVPKTGTSLLAIARRNKFLGNGHYDFY